MNKISCNLVKDLLPLVVDEVVSEETKKTVQEHLSVCEDCRKEYEQLKQKLTLPTNPDLRNESAHVLKSMKHKLARKGIIISLVSVAVTLALVITGLRGILLLQELVQSINM